MPETSIENEITNEQKEKPDKNKILAKNMPFGLDVSIYKIKKKQLSKHEINIYKFLLSKQISD